MGEAADLLGRLRMLRRDLHRVAEIGLQLPRTQSLVIAALAELGLEITLGRELTSVVGVLRAARPAPAPAVLLRADMDALPVTEETGEPFAAPAGVMHACGHDLHTAALIGAAMLLSRHRDELAGDVVLMFQPGEEGHDGAAAMIAEGVLDAAGPRVSAAYGLHVFSSTLPRGVFGTRPGPLMAASSGLFVTVRGVGGHAARPHAAADPIVVAAEMVIALQTMVTRQFDIFDPVLVTVGIFRAGTRRNVIPDSATFEATVRTFSADSLARVQDRSVRLCSQIAAAHGLQADLSFTGEYPVTVNDPDHASFALAVAGDVFGPDRTLTLPDPMMGSEDFSRVLAEVPGAFVFLGACVGDDPTTAPTNHSALARFDESVLPDAAVLLAELARRRLDLIRA
jgi:amidohydrolase